MSRVKGAPWDFKANSGDDINDGGIPERVDPPIEIPPRINVRRMYIGRMDVEKYGPTKGCPGCQKVTRGTVPSCIVATHSDACRERMEKHARSRRSGPSSQKTHVTMRYLRDSWKNTMKERRRSQDAVPMLKRRAVISHYHHCQAVEQTEQTAMCSTGRKAIMVYTSKTQK